MYIEPFKTLAAQGRWEEYHGLLCEKGLDWWFNMEIPLLAGHLMPLVSQDNETGIDHSSTDVSLPPRLTFLLETIRPAMLPDTFERLFPVFLSSGDIRGAAASAGAGVASIWDRGYDFKAFDVWYGRIEELIREPVERLDPLARASILGYKGHMEMIGRGDLTAATETFKAQRHWAEKARSSSLQAYYAFMSGYSHLWGGKLCEMEILISNTAPFVELPETSFISRVFFGLIAGLFQIIKGNISQGRTLLGRIVSAPGFEMLPASVKILSLNTLMIGIVLEGDRDAVERLAERVRRQTIAGHNFFQQAFLSLSLGIAALNTSRPYRALLYAQEAISRSQLSGSPVIGRIANLLLGEALSDLNETEDAREHLESWVKTWKGDSFHLFAIGGMLELANICYKEGRMDEARKYYEAAVHEFPEGEQFPSLFRPLGFTKKLYQSLYQKEGDSALWWSSEGKVVRIRTFGRLRLQIGEHTFYDRKWRSGRNKMLLKSLIAYGGIKVPAFKLAMLLWPDAEGDRSMGNLKVALSRLRHIGISENIGVPEWVHLRHGRISLIQGHCWVDSLAFARNFPDIINKGDIDELTRLLDFYEDDFLVSDLAESWIVQRREELREMFFKGVATLVNLTLKKEEEDIALPYTEKAINKDPLRESLYGHRMRLFLSMGYPSGVLGTYKLACRNLKQGLGIKPGRVLIALARDAGGSH